VQASSNSRVGNTAVDRRDVFVVVDSVIRCSLELYLLTQYTDKNHFDKG